MHIVVVLVVVLIFFGPSRLPSLGKSLGEAIRGFKSGIDGSMNEKKDESPAPTVAAKTALHEAPASTEEAQIVKEKTRTGQNS
jgi:sec-independent protein translocase protein TatA